MNVQGRNLHALCHVIDHPQIPNGRAFGRAHRRLDRRAELLGAAATKRQQPDRFGVDAFADPLADGLQPPALFDDLHVVVVIAVGLAVDGHANAGSVVADDLGHQRARNERVAVPHQAVAGQLLARDVERAGIVGDLVERVEDGPHRRPAGASRQGLLDPVVVEAGDHHRFANAIGLERVELAIEQGATVEIDQALGLVVDEMAEARALPRRKNDRFHLAPVSLAAPLPSKCGSDWALAERAMAWGQRREKD